MIFYIIFNLFRLIIINLIFFIIEFSIYRITINDIIFNRNFNLYRIIINGGDQSTSIVFRVLLGFKDMSNLLSREKLENEELDARWELFPTIFAYHSHTGFPSSAFILEPSLVSSIPDLVKNTDNASMYYSSSLRRPTVSSYFPVVLKVWDQVI